MQIANRLMDHMANLHKIELVLSSANYVERRRTVFPCYYSLCVYHAMFRCSCVFFLLLWLLQDSFCHVLSFGKGEPQSLMDFS